MGADATGVITKNYACYKGKGGGVIYDIKII